ncbi:MAG: hypothetical protein WC262_09170 [Bacteroidales bacterium]|jgi:hypothetical protein
MFRKESGQIDMVSLILTVVIAAVTMMVGLVVVANMETSMPDISGSALSTSLDSVMENTGTAFNFLALAGLLHLGCNYTTGSLYKYVGSERSDNKPYLRFSCGLRAVRSRCRLHYRYCRWRPWQQLKTIFSNFGKMCIACVEQREVRVYGA